MQKSTLRSCGQICSARSMQFAILPSGSCLQIATREETWPARSILLCSCARNLRRSNCCRALTMQIKHITARLVVCGSLAALLLVGGIWAYLVHSKGARAVGDYKKQLIQAGEKLKIDELLPKPVPLDRNSAGVFREAAAMLYSPSAGL